MAFARCSVLDSVLKNGGATGPGTISVVVPVYNVERYIDACLASLAQQQDSNFEVVVVDDGSTDSSMARVAAFHRRLATLRVIHQENKGLGGARNTGIAAARGEFITFLDSDDVVTANFLHALRQRQAEGDYDVVSTRVELVSEGLAFMKEPDEWPAPVLDPPALVHELVLGTNSPAIACSRLYRADLLRSTGIQFPERTPHEDLFFTYKVLRQAASVAMQAACTYRWRMRPDSIGRSLTRAHVEMLSRLRDDTDAYLESVGAAPREYWFAARRNLSLVAWFRSKANRAPIEVLEHLLASVRDRQSEIVADLSVHAEIRAPGDAVLVERVNRLLAEAESRRPRAASQDPRADSDLYDILLFPLRRYHLLEGRAVVSLLARRGLRAAFVETDTFRDGKDEVLIAAGETGIELHGLEQVIMAGIRPMAVVFWNDWDPVMRPIALSCHLAGIPTIGWVEGVNDYLDVDTGRQRFAYLRSRHVIVPGKFDRRYFSDARQTIHEGEVVRVGEIWRQRRRRAGRSRKALVNSNFSYGVLTDSRDRWVSEAVQASRDAGLVPVVSRHPFDLGKLHSEYQTKASFLDALRECRVSIQRFGSGILEALAAGVAVIYFRPAKERVDKYLDPAGAYVIASTQQELKDILAEQRYSWSEARSRDFLHLHAGLGDGAAPGDRIASIIAAVVGPADRPQRGFGHLLERWLSQIDGEHLSALGQRMGPFYGNEGQQPHTIAKALSVEVPAPMAPTLKTPFYAPFGDWLRPRSPALYRLLQITRRGVADVWHHRGWTVPLAIPIALLWIVAALAALAPQGNLLSLIALALTILFALGYLAVRSYQRFDALSGELRGLLATVTSAGRRVSQHETVLAGLHSRIETEVANHPALASLSDRDDRLAAAQATAVRAARDGDAELRIALDAAVEEVRIVRERLQSLELQSLSLHLAAALRSMRPLWVGGSALEALRTQPQVEHGHELLMAVLADDEYEESGVLAGRTLIEIGTTRENVPGQGSTQKLAVFTALTGMRFVTVDMDPANTKTAEAVLRFLNPAAQAITALGEAYLLAHPGPLDVVYLDAFDFDHARHSEDRRRRYREILKTDITDAACWKMHEACAEAVVARMEIGGVVVLDDTWTDERGAFAGKGKLAVPVLIGNGFTVVARTQQAIALRRTEKVAATRKALAGRRIRARRNVTEGGSSGD